MTPNARRILVVDDEPIKRTVLEDQLREAGYNVAAAANPLEAEPLLGNDTFDVILTDLRMPGEDGLTFLRNLRESRSEQSVIVMTAYGTVETAVEAMKLGAFDYLQKPFTTEELLLKLDRLIQYTDMASENRALKEELARPMIGDRIIGHSPAMREVLARIHAVGGTDTTILVSGESGTGKELVARMLHKVSHRSRGPYVAVSCAALPRDLIESELERFSEKRYEGERDLELVRRLVPVSDRERGMTSPLTVGQEGRLIVRRRGVDLIMGSASLGLHRVEQAIGALLAERTNYENASLTTFRDVGSRAQGLTSIQEYYRDEKTSDVVRIVIRDGRLAAGELEGMIRDTLQWMDERLSSTQRLIRVVFLLPPATVWHLRESGALASFEEHEAVGVYRLRRWKEAGLRHWFDDIGRPMPANQEVSWMEATGGWSSLLEPLMQEFFETGKAPENGTIFYEAVEDLLESCGLESVPQVKTVFQALVDFGEIETEELSEFFETEGLKPREVRSVVDFMIDLDMVVGDVKRVRPEPVLLGAVRRVVANRTGS